jgi:hypothetical protein
VLHAYLAFSPFKVRQPGLFNEGGILGESHSSSWAQGQKEQ